MADQPQERKIDPLERPQAKRSRAAAARAERHAALQRLRRDPQADPADVQRARQAVEEAGAAVQDAEQEMEEALATLLAGHRERLQQARIDRSRKLGALAEREAELDQLRRAPDADHQAIDTARHACERARDEVRDAGQALVQTLSDLRPSSQTLRARQLEALAERKAALERLRRVHRQEQEPAAVREAAGAYVAALTDFNASKTEYEQVLAELHQAVQELEPARTDQEDEQRARRVAQMAERRANWERLREVHRDAYDRVHQARLALEQARAGLKSHDKKTRQDAEVRRAQRQQERTQREKDLLERRRRHGATHRRVRQAKQAYDQAMTGLLAQERSAREQEEREREERLTMLKRYEEALAATRREHGTGFDAVQSAKAAYDAALTALLDYDRTALEAAREERVRAVAELTNSRRALVRQRRAHGRGGAVTAAEQQYARAADAVRAARLSEKLAKANIRDDIHTSLPADPADEVGQLEGDAPIVLLPVRLETRFMRIEGRNQGGELWLRIYPDGLMTDSHEPLLSEVEVAAGLNFWRMAWRDAAEGTAWAALVAQVGASRAAWIVRQTEPVNIDQFPTQPLGDGGPPQFRPLTTRPANWQHTPEARLLPDRWLVLGFREGRQIVREVSRPVQEPLALTLTLGTDGDGAAEDFPDLSGDRLPVDAEILWTFNFERAEQVGMALRLPLEERYFRQGLDLLLVLGVKSTLAPGEAAVRLARLFDSHHYTRGLAFVPQGTPTNNTGGQPAGYPPQDPGGAVSFAVERGPRLTSRRSDGARFAGALGVPREVVDHVAGADRQEGRAAHAMADALWPATIGYFLENLLAPAFEGPLIRDVRRHFVNYVRGRGPFPAFRVGDVPYGVLPVTSLDDWPPPPSRDTTALDLRLSFELQTWRESWKSLIRDAYHIGRDGDPDVLLALVLGLDASAREVRVRSTQGHVTWETIGEVAGVPMDDWWETQQRMAAATVDTLGYPEMETRPWTPAGDRPGQVGVPVSGGGGTVSGSPAVDATGGGLGGLQPPGPDVPATGAGGVLPPEESASARVAPGLDSTPPEPPRTGPAGEMFPDRGMRILGMTFQDRTARFRCPLVTHKPLSESEGLESHSNYIRWLGNADPQRLRDQAFPFGDEPPLLYLLLRHAMLSEFRVAALQSRTERDGSQPQARAAPLAETELVRATPATRDQATIWEIFEQPVAGLTGRHTLWQHLHAGAAPAGTLTPQQRLVSSFLASLRSLEGLPTAELERLLTETLDVCSHRLDAWITSLATWRLEGMRQQRPQGCHLGAYGWVENLRPDETEAESEGYIYAPSMQHGAAAAVLRNAYLTRGGPDQQQYAVNLSSARVRNALWLLDAIRDGQPLGAVLGYRFERGLHERQLDRYIDGFRRRFPLVAYKASGQVDEGSVESVAARNVVDGLALRRAWNRGVLGPQPDAGIDAELRALDDAVDAVSDLLLAESVFQVVCGNTAGAGATLDTMAQGVRPPEPEIARVPRGGIPLYHRVGLVVGVDPVPDVAWGNPHTPRARAEPHLNAWVGNLLGDPTRIVCQVTFRHLESEEVTDGIRVRLKQLGLDPLDCLALAKIVETQSLDSELDRRVLFTVSASHARARRSLAEGAHVEIAYHPSDIAADETSFAQALEIARTLNGVLSHARPLRPEDLLPPEEAARPAEVRVSELAARADAAVTELSAAIQKLAAALALDANTSLDRLRQALSEAAAFGLPSAFPVVRGAAGGGLPAALHTQGESVLGEMNRRLEEADTVTPELERALDRVADRMPGVDPAELRQAAGSGSLARVASVLSAAGLPGNVASVKSIASALEQAANIADQRELAPALVAQANSRLKAVFGRDFVALPHFRPANPQELQRALDIGPDMGDDPERAINIWLAQAARVRQPLNQWRRLGFYAGAMGRPLRMPRVAQLPHIDPGGNSSRESDGYARWVGLGFDSQGERPPAGRVSLVLHRPATPAANAYWAGLLLDEWTELIPNTQEDAGVVFHFDSPGAEAPQAVLIAVPPPLTERWDLDVLINTLRETLELAKMRGSDGDRRFGAILPLTYLATNAANETVSTDLSGCLETETLTVIREE